MINVNPDKNKKPQPRDRSYAELRDALTHLPATWYPALIQTLVVEAIKHRVFTEYGGASRYVAEIERLLAHRPEEG